MSRSLDKIIELAKNDEKKVEKLLRDTDRFFSSRRKLISELDKHRVTQSSTQRVFR